MEIDRLTTSRPLPWAAFLACSWTWCIGMYLPVILVREMGPWGWVVFAVPNVIGAAAMGWVLGDADASRRFVVRHRSACLGFSLVTVLFHVFFTGWMIHQLLGWPSTLATPLLAAAIWLIGRTRRRRDLLAAGIVLGLSLAAFVWVATTAGLFPPAAQPQMSPFPAALWLAPACLFGFLLCPYLDLTFHRARQGTTPAGGRLAFGLGFGVLFLAMIVFSLWYAPLLSASEPAGSPGRFSGASLAAIIIALHMLLQTAFTMAIHLREFPGVSLGAASPGGMRDSRPPQFFAGLVGALLLVVAVPFVLAALTPSGGEAIYLVFMGFYGLLFPAYVWLCAVPGRDRSAPGPTPRSLTVLLVCTLLAAPMFWFGFVEMHLVWLAPGLAVVLLGRLFVHPGQQPTAGTAPPAVR